MRGIGLNPNARWYHIQRARRYLQPKRRASGYYPAGAENDPRAPYNQPDLDEDEEEELQREWERQEEIGDYQRERLSDEQHERRMEMASRRSYAG